MSRIKIPVNLASEPFRRDRPILAASAVTAVLMVALLAMLVSTIMTQREAARDSREMLDTLVRQIR